MREGVNEIYGERLGEVFFIEASQSFNHQSKEGDDDITLLVMKVEEEE